MYFYKLSIPVLPVPIEKAIKITKHLTKKKNTEYYQLPQKIPHAAFTSQSYAKGNHLLDIL